MRRVLAVLLLSVTVAACSTAAAPGSHMQTQGNPAPTSTAPVVPSGLPATTVAPLPPVVTPALTPKPAIKRTPSPTARPTPRPTPQPTPAPTLKPIPTANDPYAAATAAGATAVCADRTWSYSQHRSGTCSRHGGVHWWTGNLGPAGPGGH